VDAREPSSFVSFRDWILISSFFRKKPGMSVSDVAKAAGVEWGKLKDKTKWEKKAEEDKKRYERELASYKVSLCLNFF
jgi:hypothetical protein